MDLFLCVCVCVFVKRLCPIDTSKQLFVCVCVCVCVCVLVDCEWSLSVFFLLHMPSAFLLLFRCLLSVSVSVLFSLVAKDSVFLSSSYFRERYKCKNFVYDVSSHRRLPLSLPLPASLYLVSGRSPDRLVDVDVDVLSRLSCCL